MLRTNRSVGPVVIASPHASDLSHLYIPYMRALFEGQVLCSACGEHYLGPADYVIMQHFAGTLADLGREFGRKLLVDCRPNAEFGSLIVEDDRVGKGWPIWFHLAIRARWNGLGIYPFDLVPMIWFRSERC